MPSDKLNQVDYRWHIVRTLPRQERKLADLLERHQSEFGNILEVYCPTHTTVSVQRGGSERPVPLFAGAVFVLSTHQALADFLARYYPDGHVLYARKSEGGEPAKLWTVPERQMRAFKDFNENYADQMVVLERPYSDYAFNPKTNQPNEIVRVIDGPLAGREGYIAKFRRDKRLVFQMRGLHPGTYFAVSLPHVWDFHVVRLHNAEGDRQTLGTQKERAADLLLGLLQATEPESQVIPLFHSVLGRLIDEGSFAHLRQHLIHEGHEALASRVAKLTPSEAQQLLALARYERDCPGYLRHAYPSLVLRPFLTPTSGWETPGEEQPPVIERAGKHFREIIQRVEIPEAIYYPSQSRSGETITPYYAHIGVITRGQSHTLFTNWDHFLREYFLTAGNAHRKLVSGTAPDTQQEKLFDSFRNYAPLLYKVFTDPQSPVKPIKDFPLGDHRLNVMAITGATHLAQAQTLLVQTCVNICRELNATTHLAVWRRYLRAVWLHG